MAISHWSSPTWATTRFNARSARMNTSISFMVVCLSGDLGKRRRRRRRQARGPGAAGRRERLGPGGPCAVELGDLGIAVIELEDHHPVGEAPEGLGQMRIARSQIPGLASPL